MKTVTILLPFYNEGQNLEILYSRIEKVIKPLKYNFQILLVNDGSCDESSIFANKTAQTRKNVHLVELSRNFGQQTAVLAGLQFSKGDAVILMDTDLQDRPEAIPFFIKEWEKGASVVYAIRRKRKENFLKRFLFGAFYIILSGMSEIKIPEDAGLFGLMDRRVVDVIKSMPEHHRFTPGLRAWTGFRQVGIEVERDERPDGKPRNSFWRLLKLAADAIFSFSRIPLRIATALGIVASALAVIGAIIVFYKKFISHQAIPGWTSILLSIFFFGAVQLITIGIIGEYVGRIYEEVKKRPHYVVKKIILEETENDG